MAALHTITHNPRFRSASATTAWVVVVAVLGAALELGSLAALRWSGRDFLFVPLSVGWMVLVFHLVAVTVIAVSVAIGSRLVPFVGQPRVVAWLAGAWITSGALLPFFPRLHVAAIALAACGVGVTLARLESNAPGRLARLAQAPVLVGAAWIAMVTPLLGWRDTGIVRGAAAPPGAPNVVLIFLDTVRGDHFGILGHDRPTTPALDELGRSGVVFERAIAPAPWTLPSHASAFTGRWPSELSADWRSALDESPATLAEQLARAGYQTAGFAANTRFVSYESGLSRGFEHYEGYTSSVPRVFLASAIGRLLASTERLRGLIGTEWNLDRRGAAGIRLSFEHWLDQRDPSRPVFAFLNFFDAHHPYDSPESYDGRFGSHQRDPSAEDRLRSVVHPAPLFRRDSAGLDEMQKSYDECLRYLDDEIGRLLEGLRRSGMTENTIVIVAADHGEHFGENGLVDHGNSLYFPLLRVPLLVAWPGHVPRGVRVSQPVSLRDIPATIQDLADISDLAQMPGNSLRNTWVAQGAPVSPALSMVTGIRAKPRHEPLSRGDMAALVVDSLIVIRNGDCRYEVFDVEDDPANANDIADRKPELTRQLAHLVDSLAPYESGAPDCGRLRRSSGRPTAPRAPRPSSTAVVGRVPGE